MTAPCFVDTNVLVYADDGAAGDKRHQARELIRTLALEGRGKVSLQVLQEYFAAATRKLGISAENARRKVELLARLDVVSLDITDILAAIDLHRLHRLSIWDALIVRAALISGCQILFTEDMQDHRRIDGVEIVNPFAPPGRPRSAG